MNHELFREHFPDLMTLRFKASKGDADLRYLLARYEHAVGKIDSALRGYLDGTKVRHAASMYYAGLLLFSNSQSMSNQRAVKYFCQAAGLGEKRAREEYERSGLKPFEPYFPTGAESAYRAGKMFEDGVGVRRDSYEAFYYYDLSVKEAEHPGGMVALASLYRRGIGTKHDLGKAVDLLRQAADREFPVAFYELGLMYDKYGGLDEDPAMAAEYYWEAARRGHGIAAHSLATQFAAGTGIEQDLVAALLWFGWAKHRGVPYAQIGIKRIMAKLAEKEVTRSREIFVGANENFANTGLFDAEH